MAQRPLAFGVRLRDKQRTVRVRTEGARRYVVEDSRTNGKTRKREHTTLTEALRDLALTWRHRLH